MALLLVLALVTPWRAARYRWPLAMRQMRLAVRQLCRVALVISVGLCGCVARRVCLVVRVLQDSAVRVTGDRLRFRGCYWCTQWCWCHGLQWISFDCVG